MSHPLLHDPEHEFNKKCLADVQKKYPDMTMQELMDRRDNALSKIRQVAIDAGLSVPEDDYLFIGYLKEIGILP